jgi:hypothetical protein
MESTRARDLFASHWATPDLLAWAIMHAGEALIHPGVVAAERIRTSPNPLHGTSDEQREATHREASCYALAVSGWSVDMLPPDLFVDA